MRAVTLTDAARHYGALMAFVAALSYAGAPARADCDPYYTLNVRECLRDQLEEARQAQQQIDDIARFRALHEAATIDSYGRPHPDEISRSLWDLQDEAARHRLRDALR
jgi:hypothetical protein